MEIVSTVDDAIGLAPSMTLPVCCAAPTTVCNQEKYLICEFGFDENSLNRKILQLAPTVEITTKKHGCDTTQEKHVDTSLFIELSKWSILKIYYFCT